MKKLLLTLTLLTSISTLASDLYKCELTRSNLKGFDQKNTTTGWLKADKIGNTLKLGPISDSEVSAAAAHTRHGLEISICDSDNKCIFTDPVTIGKYARLTSTEEYDGYRINMECTIY